MNISLDCCLAHGTNDNRHREWSRIQCGRIIKLHFMTKIHAEICYDDLLNLIRWGNQF